MGIGTTAIQQQFSFSFLKRKQGNQEELAPSGRTRSGRGARGRMSAPWRELRGPACCQPDLCIDFLQDPHVMVFLPPTSSDRSYRKQGLARFASRKSFISTDVFGCGDNWALMGTQGQRRTWPHQGPKSDKSQTPGRRQSSFPSWPWPQGLSHSESSLSWPSPPPGDAAGTL